MFKESYAFSGFSVNDIEEAREFYGDVLGLDIVEDPMGLRIKLNGGNSIFVYQKDDHVPASYTVLNFPVEDIDMAVDTLIGQGVEPERYSDMPNAQDEKGILRGVAAGQGPDIGWFKDPAGNILSVLSD
ncbi:MAG: VOC family protein [Candidatus Saccharibacteria bacterium]